LQSEEEKNTPRAVKIRFIVFEALKRQHAEHRVTRSFPQHL
jgi:hypothetical protein